MNLSYVNLRPSAAMWAAILLSIGCTMLGFLAVNSISQRQSWNVSEVISQDIRDACSVESPSVNQLVFKGVHGKVVYTFNVGHRSLIRMDGLRSEKLLTEVDSLSFSLLRPAACKMNSEFMPANTGKARAVACSWSCSRKIAGLKLNSEEGGVPAILLRNR